MPKHTHIKTVVGADGTRTRRKQCSNCGRWLAVDEYGFNACGTRRSHCNNCITSDTYWRKQKKILCRYEDVYQRQGLRPAKVGYRLPEFLKDGIE